VYAGTSMTSRHDPYGRRFAAAAALAAAVLAAQVLLAEVFWVTTTADSGPGSLRDALEQSNIAPGADEVRFDPALHGETILLTSGSLEVCDDLRLLGPGDDLLTVARDETAAAFRVLTIDDGSDDLAVVEIEGITITDGSHEWWGAGILSFEDLTIISSTISHNQVVAPPGELARAVGAGVASEGPLALIDTTVTDNYAAATQGQWGNHARGGGISVHGDVTLMSSTVSNNRVLQAADPYVGTANGGGLYASGRVVARGSTFSGNYVRTGGHLHRAIGGGISSNLEVDPQTSSVVGNYARASWSAHGGGVNAPTVLVSYSLISGNSVRAGDSFATGGGIFAQSCTISNTTISGNVASQGSPALGGGVWAGSATIISSTISGNRAADYGGGVYADGSLVVSSTIAAGNTCYWGPDVYGPFSGTTASYNLIGDPAGSRIPIGTDGNITGDPLLGPLQDNGGPTWTHALDPASPAVDAGANPAGLVADQRNYLPREVGGRADIGAYELGARSPTIFDDGYESGDTSAWAMTRP